MTTTAAAPPESCEAFPAGTGRRGPLVAPRGVLVLLGAGEALRGAEGVGGGSHSAVVERAEQGVVCGGVDEGWGR